jgi:peptidoglycan/xylan/chitin deacetylase (PgdA/CDA1 family)
MFTFDFDAETMWLSRNPDNARRPGVLSQGKYGAKRGVYEILKLLSDEKLPATFFVPGWVAEKHTAQVEEILAKGFEVGHHGYLHEWINPDFPKEEEEALDRGLEALEKTVGVKPKGFRSPAGESSENMIRLLNERGFKWDSSLMDDVFPYQLKMPDGSPGPVELPWHWSIDDAPFANFAIQLQRPIFTNEHIISIWQAEFQEIYRWGGLFNLVNHPQIIGRPSRIAMLRQFIEFTRSFSDAWYATGSEVEAAYTNQC